MKKETKDNLLTIRLTTEEKHQLDLLSDRMDKSISDTIIRACKYLINMGEQCVLSDDASEKKENKIHRVHLRMTSSDVGSLKNRSDEMGITISRLIREAIKALSGSSGIPY